MREVEEHTVYNAEMRRQNDIRMLIENSFGPAAGTPGTEHYYAAYDEINKIENHNKKETVSFLDTVPFPLKNQFRN